MVITVTMNPAFDKTIIVDDFQKNALNKIKDVRIDLGGKGINVSKILTTLEIDNRAIILAGDLNFKELENELNKYSLKSEIIFNPNSHTRENIKIQDERTKSITELNEKGKVENKEVLSNFKNKFLNIISKDDIVVISGSVPKGVPDDFYKSLIDIAKEKEAFVILDASGVQLENSIISKPNIIKPNEFELSGIKFSKEEIIDKEISILLSKGKDGFEYLDNKNHLRVEGFKVDAKSTVGAGDSLLAGFVYGLNEGYSLEESLIMARACATAKVVTEGTAQVPKNKIEEYYIREGLKWLRS
jgi:1-phosphofructokinase